MSDFAYGDVSGSLREDELTLGYLEQSGVTERLKRKGVTEVAINRPFEIWIETSADGWLREEAPG